LPMIYAVAMLNMCIVIAVCINKGMSIWGYGWMFAVLLISAVRLVTWIRHAKAAQERPADPRLLKTLSIGAAGGISFLSAWTVWGISSGFLANEMLIPVSLVFGATCIAHCLVAVRVASTSVLVGGILPSAMVMLGSPDFQIRMLGLSMATIAILMIRFVREQYDQLVSSLLLEQQITDNANTDALTGLRNRRAIMEAIEAEEAACAAGGRSFAIALLDLDGFKAVNDTHGHHVGDQLLQEASLRLSAAVPTGDLVGRLGGDEFIILLRNFATAQEVAARAAALLTALCRPADIGTLVLPLSASLGYALYPSEGETAADLMIAADQALYTMKRGRAAARNMRLIEPMAA
jgi:diguanylate cyclase